MRLLTREQAQELDRIAIDELGIPGTKLMGNAGAEVAKFAQNMVSEINNPKIAVICGKGNNSGDGYKAALDLKLSGLNPNIFMLFDEKSVVGDSLQYYELCKKENLPIITPLEFPSENYDIIIDAILGTGFKGELRDPILKYTQWINSQNSLVLSVDVPSGVNANNGNVAKNAVKADVTITMGHAKVGMMLQPAKSICGEIKTVDIGFPNIYDKLKGMKFSCLNEDLAFEHLNAPNVSTYKHKQGKVLILAGSEGMTGAAILASKGAIRSGAGLVATFAPKSLSNVYESNIIEGLTISCQDDNLGYFTENNYSQIEKYFDWADAMLIGSGIGTNQLTLRLVKKIVTKFEKPLIIDADALNIFSNNLDLFNSIKSELVITPHYGEFARLINKDMLDFKENIIEELDAFSKVFNGSLVAKNAPTIISNGNNVFINTTGNQGMATGGTGDVLAGIIASFAAQGFPSKIAAELGVYIHGKAADIVKESKGLRGLIASDIIEILPLVLKVYE